MRRFIFTLFVVASFGLGAVAQKAKIFDVRNGSASSVLVNSSFQLVPIS